MLFEEIIRENLDRGRPDMVQLIFDRRVTKRTPGRFRTRVLTDGVIPSLHIDYKNTRIKQYFKQVPEAREVGAAPRLPSTTHATFPSASGCVTCPLCGRSAFKPTDVFSSRTSQPGLRRGRRSDAEVESAGGGKWATGCGSAHHRPPGPGTVASAGLVSSVALWFRQSGSAGTTRSPHRARAPSQFTSFGIGTRVKSRWKLRTFPSRALPSVGAVSRASK
jgi:hypothetical protein